MIELPLNDRLWQQLEILLPPTAPHPRGGRPRLADREALNGILYVLTTRIPWERLPQALGYGSGMTCWRRLREWQQAGAWERVEQALRSELLYAEQVDWHRTMKEMGRERRLS